jgi:thiamine biosynthesis protein ThiI
LEKPKRKIFVEARKEGFYLYFKKEKGAGGLPVGTSGKVLALISGGIDSPVASYLMAKRGAENVWLHFHSFPLVSQKSIEKVKKLAEIFLKFQPRLKVYLFPFSKIQMEIRVKSKPKYRILLYRRAMMKITENLAKKENCYAIVTGESLGQVSSQTLPNLQIIEKAVSIPILRPLIGMNKEEIINLAKKIGTYQISILPQEDCCTLFIPKHASAKGNLKEIEKIEKGLNLKKLIKQFQEEIEVLQF